MIFSIKSESENVRYLCAALGEALKDVKSESENVRYLCAALGEALKDVKLNDEKVQKKFDKVVGYINFINSFIGCKLKLEYDAN